MTLSSDQRQSPPGKPRSRGPVVPHTPGWYQRVGAWLVFVLLRAVAATLRVQWTDRSGYYRSEGSNSASSAPAIFAVWHNRLAVTMTAYYGYARKRSRSAGLAALVSASKDGALLAAILEAFKVQPVRGSSSRRGPQALLELTTWAERGYDLAITPDGPRGPCYRVQDGIMSLAQITGLPIIPFSCHLAWKLRAKSWDRFQIPLPFSKCEMIVEKPIRVPREAADTERQQLQQQLESVLKAISDDS
jgi:lysophospholipid acyltransferase (LPLAT)-like uncharacterized protein